MTENETPLESWKEIAAYLQRDVTTVRRWERKEGLPVHRHSHSSRSSVYAYSSEIDAWRASRRIAPEQTAAPLWKALLAPHFAATIVLSLILVGNGIRPQLVSAQQPGQTRTMICSGSDCGQGELPPDVESLLIKAGVNYAPIRKLRAALPPAQGTNPYEWILSPDGSRIAYTPMLSQGNFRNITPSGEVHVVNANGTGSRMLYRGGSPLAWSPDARRVLVVSGEPQSQMVWVDATNGSVEKLPPHWNVQGPKVSPDGRYIAFSGAQDRNSIENMIVMASDGSHESVISPSPAFQTPLAWMPDGKHLLYLQHGGPVSLWSAEMENGKIQGAPAHVLLELAKEARVLGISRSGALYYSVQASSRDIYTASMDPASGKVTSAPALVPVLQTGLNLRPRWSPDSRRLLYLSREAGKDNPALHLYASGDDAFNNGHEEPVPAGLEALMGYCWSKDGASFYGSAQGKATQFVRINFADGKIIPVPVKAAAARPGIFELSDCSGDLAIGRTQSEVQARNLADGTVKDIYRVDSETGLGGAVISHDQQSLAFTTQTFDRGALSAPVAIHIVSSNGGPVRDLNVATAPTEIHILGLAWSPDDRFLYFTRRLDARSPFELFRIPAAGGAAESMGLKAEGLRDIDIAPDGRRIAFSSGSGGTEIWAVQGFLPAKR